MIEIHEDLKIINNETSQQKIQARLNLAFTHLAGVVAFAYAQGGNDQLRGVLDKIEESEAEEAAAQHEMPHSDDIELKI